ncbi:colanic acid biosynthesis acetyltransferase WcaF [Bacteroidia bacterium]|nr:colanic acid biosynthesis acetyltransferase WcaF [Bacteroidia bacterium]
MDYLQRTYKFISWKNKLLRSLWNMVYTLFFRPFGTKIFKPWRLFILRIFGAKIHSEAGVYASVKIWAPWNLEMHRNAWLGPHVICYNMDKVILEEDVTVSQYVHLCAASHDINEINNPVTSLITAPIIIKSKAWIGTQAFIGLGVCIGEGAVVGATAAVFKDVESWTVVGGNPAKFIKKREIKS